MTFDEFETKIRYKTDTVDDPHYPQDYILSCLNDAVMYVTDEIHIHNLPDGLNRRKIDMATPAKRTLLNGAVKVLLPNYIAGIKSMKYEQTTDSVPVDIEEVGNGIFERVAAGYSPMALRNKEYVAYVLYDVESFQRALLIAPQITDGYLILEYFYRPTPMSINSTNTGLPEIWDNLISLRAAYCMLPKGDDERRYALIKVEYEEEKSSRLLRNKFLKRGDPWHQV